MPSIAITIMVTVAVCAAVIIMWDADIIRDLSPVVGMLLVVAFLLYRHARLRTKQQGVLAAVSKLCRAGHDAKVCDTCRGRGHHGLSVLLVFGRTLLTKKACEECKGSGLLLGCRSCGYDLTGNLSGACPECGTETRQSLSQAK